ncbi:MAG: alpha/beta fold hydrolase [Pseudomonadota bacterium]
MTPPWRLVVLFAALSAIVASIVKLEAPYRALITQLDRVGETPLTVQFKRGTDPSPVVVIAHGFAGSRQLMQPFAVTLARNGYTVVSFDYLGHGRNANRLTGDITREDGATEALVAETEKVVAYARSLHPDDGRIAILGHSMASDILVRVAQADEEIAALIAVSMFSEQVTQNTPSNLLVIVGEYEQFLTQAALKTIGLMGVSDPNINETYVIDGVSRRVAVAPGVEHISVLYSASSLREALTWLDRVFQRQSDGWIELRAPWLGYLFAAIIALSWPLSAWLKKIPRTAPHLTSRRFVALIGLAMLATPLALWPLPTGTLPVLVADYLALHFLLFGVVLAVGLWRSGNLIVQLPSWHLMLQTTLATVFVILAIAWPLDRYVASFVPASPDRIALVALLAFGTLSYCLADAWLTSCAGRRWWWPLLSKSALLLSLSIAVALNLRELFFLIIIFPAIILFFLVYGIFSFWLFRATEHPTVGGVALGLAFAWALGVTFPLVAS